MLQRLDVTHVTLSAAVVYLALSLTASLYLMKVDLQKSDSLRYSLHIFYTL